MKELLKRWKEGSAVRAHPDALTLSFPTHLPQRWTEGQQGQLFYTTLSSTPCPDSFLANAKQGQHLVHFIHFKTEWPGVTFLLLFLEKYSLGTNFPYFPQAAKYTKQAEAFFLNASGGCGSNSLVLFQRPWINGYGITITEQRIITCFLLLCDSLHWISGCCSTSDQFCSWMLGVCVVGIKFFCLEHFCTNHSQICDCVRTANCSLLWKALRLWGA